MPYESTRSAFRDFIIHSRTSAQNQHIASCSTRWPVRPRPRPSTGALNRPDGMTLGYALRPGAYGTISPAYERTCEAHNLRPESFKTWRCANQLPTKAGYTDGPEPA